jgi:hypothetical protein
VKIFAHLTSDVQAHAVLVDLWKQLRDGLRGGKRYEVEVRDERRNSEQNALLHVLIGEIAKSVEWAGKKRDPDTWKRLLTAAWMRAQGESVEILPALDGHGVDVVFRHTASLSVAECADLITFIQAWMAEHEVTAA